MAFYKTLFAGVLLTQVVLSARAQNPPGGFGDSIPISNGFMGRIYLLKEGSDSLPRFDTMQPVGMPIYAATLNIPDRDWSDGFPGLRQRNEWFGMDYKGEFKVVRDGVYTFRLVSDDGARLLVGNRVLIDEDGTHPSYSRSAGISLSRDSAYPIEVQYYQGPRYRLALQLFWTRAGDSLEQVFPGPGIVVRPAATSSFPWWWVVLGALVLGTLIGLWLRKKNRKRPLTTV
jgi:hypothetical protein